MNKLVELRRTNTSLRDYFDEFYTNIISLFETKKLYKPKDHKSRSDLVKIETKVLIHHD